MEYNKQRTAERIRQIRKEHKVSQEKLIFDLKEFQGLGISRNTLSDFENGEKQCTLDFLIAFSNYFNCDIGYLLCEYDEKTMTSHQICVETGLSQKAIENIVSWKNTVPTASCPIYIHHLSSILESEKMEDIMVYIGQELRLANVEGKCEQVNINDEYLQINKEVTANSLKNLQMARLWYLSKTFTDIIEDMATKERLKGGVSNGNNKQEK